MALHVKTDLPSETAQNSLPPLIKRDFVQQTSDGGDLIRIMQWNMLAYGLSHGSDNFICCPEEALDWETRKLRVIQEIVCYKPAILCMEEVDAFDFLMENLSKLGYLGIFFPKPSSPCFHSENNIGPDGCALFYNTSQISLERSDSVILKENTREANQVLIVSQLKTKTARPKQFYVAVTHLKAKEGFENNRKLQGEYLLKYLNEKCHDAPVIVCGDFNADPSEPVYTVMKSRFSSAYTSLSKDGTEPKYTTWKIRPDGESCHTIDYIWYSSQGFKVKSVLDIASDEEIGENRLPSLKYPSDHLSLVCDFLFKE